MKKINKIVKSGKIENSRRKVKDTNTAGIDSIAAKFIKNVKV